MSASRASWTVAPHHGSQQGGSSSLAKLRDRILTRDNQTCQGCGWRSEQWQEIHHRDGDHRNRRERNLEVLCPLCHQVFHLPQAGATGGGSVIWLPEIDQATLNRMCIALFVAMRDPSGAWAGTAKSIHGTLEARRATMEAAFGRSDPGMVAQVLIKMKPEQYADRARALAPLRLLAHPARFQYEIEYWDAAYFKDMDPSQWEKFASIAQTA
jgi:intracellular multiplication protein IcmJ